MLTWLTFPFVFCLFGCFHLKNVVDVVRLFSQLFVVGLYVSRSIIFVEFHELTLGQMQGQQFDLQV